MSIKIMVDTNLLVGRNSFDKLFGNRIELENILEIYDTELVIPSIVIDELLHQKSQHIEPPNHDLRKAPTISSGLLMISRL